MLLHHSFGVRHARPRGIPPGIFFISLRHRQFSSTPQYRANNGSSTVLHPNDIVFPPYQGHSVKLSVINGATTQMLSQMLVHPAPQKQRYMRLADYSFLIESENRNQKVMFDLAFMKDLFTRMPPALKAMFEVKPGQEDVMTIESVCDVPDTLEANGIGLDKVNDIIWSHSHIDHVGDPSVFPPSTNLIVGPGFKENYMPGYPTNPQAFVLDSAFEGRAVNEIDFSSNPRITTIGGFRALDFFDDGSFFLLECPGHTGHHIGALCRTTEDSWVFLGADCCHNIAQLRPSQFRPLPEHISQDVLHTAKSKPPAPCMCTHLSNRLLQSREGQPVFDLAPMLQEDVGAAQDTLEKLKAFDGRDDVMVILAHDPTLLETVDFFPKDINRWRVMDWAEQGRWKFLETFK